ncbi:MAG: extracellular solute-binding protein [Verrucomicrobiota bacterium]
MITKHSLKKAKDSLSFTLIRSAFLRSACLIFCFISIFGAVTPIVSAQEGDGDGESKTLLRIMDLPTPRETGATAQVGRTLVRNFLAQNPEYQLEPFQMLEVTGSMDEGPLKAIASGLPPHGLYVNFRQSSTYINHGFLEPLDILLARLRSDNPRVRQADEQGNWLAEPAEEEVEEALEILKEQVNPNVWPVVYREAAGKAKDSLPPGKHVWAMPQQVVSKALVYRKDVFKKAGLDPEKPPETWEEFLEFAQKIKAQPNLYGFTYQRGDVVSYQLFDLFASNGVRYLEQDKEGKWKPAFNTREMAEAVYFALRLTREEFTEDGEKFTGAAYAPMGSGEQSMKWDRGEIGMRMQSLSFDRITDINPAVTGVVPVPKSPQGERGNIINARMLGVFSGSSPAQKLGVMKYIMFMNGNEAKRLHTRIMVEQGYGRFLDPSRLEKFGYDDVLRRVSKEWVETVKQSQDDGVPEPYGKNTQRIYQYISTPINWALDNPALLELPKETALDRIQKQLDAAASRINRHMLEDLTPEEERTRSIWGGVLLIAIIAVFTFSIGRVWRGFTKAERELGDRGLKRRFVKAYLILMPALLITGFTKYFPLVLGTPLALMDFQLAIDSTFVGIQNFATVLYDPRFWQSLGRTFYYVLLVVGLGFWPPILVAFLLDEVPTTPAKYTFRTIFYLPTIVSGVIMVFLWRQFYEPSESGFLNQIILSFNGLGPVAATLVRLIALGLWFSLIFYVIFSAIKLKELNWPVRTAVTVFGFALLGATLFPLVDAYIGPSELVIEAQNLDPAEVQGWGGLFNYLGGFIGEFNLEPLGWIEDPRLAMLCVVLPMVWATAGPGCIIYLAALKTVPEELVEAATIDGASILQRLAYITLPRVKFLILIQLLGSVVGAFKGGTNFILALTGGGPNGATRTLGMDIFERAFMELQFSTAATMGWILGGVVITFTSFQLLRMSRATFKRTEPVE